MSEPAFARGGSSEDQQSAGTLRWLMPTLPRAVVGYSLLLLAAALLALEVLSIFARFAVLAGASELLRVSHWQWVDLLRLAGALVLAAVGYRLLRRSPEGRDGTSSARMSVMPPLTPVPRTLKWAAVLFLAYGLATVLNATAMQAGAGWGEPWALPRALLRLAVSGLVAWGLLRGARWAWWLGLLWAVFSLASAALAVLVFERGDIRWEAPSHGQLLLTGALLSLGGAVALLLTPSARAALRAR